MKRFQFLRSFFLPLLPFASCPAFEFPGQSESRDLDKATAILDKTYRRLKSSLDEAQTKRLVEAERAWIKWREAEVDLVAHFTAVGGSALRVDLLTADLELTRARTQMLKSYMNKDR